jgi:hypothetical protein
MIRSWVDGSHALVEIAVPAEFNLSAPSTSKSDWPSLISCALRHTKQEEKLGWLLFRVASSLVRFTFNTFSTGLVVASLRPRRSCHELVSDIVLYRWLPSLSLEDWVSSIFQSNNEGLPADHQLPLHPDSSLPLTPFMVIWETEQEYQQDYARNIK